MITLINFHRCHLLMRLDKLKILKNFRKEKVFLDTSINKAIILNIPTVYTVFQNKSFAIVDLV